jgi:redox-sensitive bicupin YhaK (pirin superfamily)
LKTLFHPASERGHANHGWLKANHSFSFANWYDPNRVHFGCLRVWNDDWIAQGMGFGTHPHNNMEIVTIPLGGVLEHADSMGHREKLHTGEVQAMSAGSGITHSEYNGSATEPCTLFQIWVLTAQQGATPRYGQVAIRPDSYQDQWNFFVGPDSDPEVDLHIYQNAWFSQIESPQGGTFPYSIQGGADQGVYFMVVQGNAAVAAQSLSNRDAQGVWEVESGRVDVVLSPGTRVVAVEVPMTLPAMH